MKFEFVAVIVASLGFSAVASADACVEQCKREARQDRSYCQSVFEQCVADGTYPGSSFCSQQQTQCMASMSPNFSACVDQCSYGDFPVFPNP
jgi:hypothetical protein